MEQTAALHDFINVIIGHEIRKKKKKKAMFNVVWTPLTLRISFVKNQKLVSQTGLEQHD